MKRLTVVVPALLFLFVVTFCISEPAFGRQINTGQHYTWGISNSNPDILDGSIITEAVLTIHAITNTASPTSTKTRTTLYRSSGSATSPHHGNYCVN